MTCRNIISLLVLMLCSAFPKVYGQGDSSVKYFKDHGSCLYGFIKSSGDTLIPAQYAYVKEAQNGFFVVSNGVRSGLIRQKDGRLVLNFAYQSLEPVKKDRTKYARGWYLFRKDDAWGLLHLIKGEVHPAQYLYIPDEIQNGGFVAEHVGDRWTYLDTTGYSNDFDDYSHVSLSVGPNFIAAKKDSLYALFTPQGEQVSAFRFQFLVGRPNGHIYFSNKPTSGWINQSGEVLFEARKLSSKYYYREHTHVNKVLYKLTQAGATSFGLLDTSQKLHWAIPPIYDSLGANAERNYVHGFKNGKQFLWNWQKERLVVSKASSAIIPEYGDFAYFIRKKKLLQVHLQEGTVRQLGKASQCYVHEVNKVPYVYWRKGEKWSFLKENGNVLSLKTDSIYPLIVNCSGRVDTLVVCWQKGLLSVLNTDGAIDETFALDEYPFTQVYRLFGESAYLFVSDNGDFMAFNGCGSRQQPADDWGSYTSGFEKLDDDIIKFKGSDGLRGLLSLKHGLLLEPEYHWFKKLGEAFIQVVYPNGEGTGLYSLSEQRLIVVPDQYPVFEINFDKERVRFGFEDRICILDFWGNVYAEWENVADIEPFGDGYMMVAVDSFSIGLRAEWEEENDNWLVPPTYCAIADYNKEKGLASVRTCPIAVVDMDAFQDGDYSSPTEDNWGLVDSDGNWVIEPFSKYPIDLMKEVQVLIDEQGEHYLYHLSGKRKWKKGYPRIWPVQEGVHLYWVTSKAGKRGLKTEEGAWHIPLAYDKIIRGENATYLAIVEAESLGDVQVFEYNRSFDSTKIEGLAKMRLLFKYLGQDDTGEEILAAEYSSVTLKEAMEKWHHKRWFATRNEYQEMGDLDARMEDYGFCHPAFRVEEHFQGWTPYARWDEEYVEWKVAEHGYGVSMIGLHSVCNVGTRGAGYCYEHESFVNLKLHKDVMKPLRLWDVLDSTKSDVLIDTLVTRINASGLDLDCAQNGNYIEVVKESFLVSPNSIKLYLPRTNRVEYPDRTENNYLVVSLGLKYWGLREY